MVAMPTIECPTDTSEICYFPHDDDTDTSFADAAYDKKLARIEKRIEKRSKKRSRVMLKIGATGLALNGILAAYQLDVAHNMEQSRLSHPTISTIEDAQDSVDADSAIYFAAGFDTNDGEVFGKRVGGAYQQITPGSTESINYEEAPLEPSEIAEQIILDAEQKHLTHISIAGNSMGGIIAVKTAEYIIEHSELVIDALYLNSTPDGTDGLRPSTESSMATMTRVMEFIPNAKYSKLARYVLTMGQSSGTYLGADNPLDFVGKFQAASHRAVTAISEKRQPGAWLAVDQAAAITHADLQDAINHIGELRGEKHMPVIIYTGAEDPSDDKVVDIPKSSTSICSYATEAGLSCLFVPVPGAIHTSYLFDSEQYKKALATASDRARSAIGSEYVSDSLVDIIALQEEARAIAEAAIPLPQSTPSEATSEAILEATTPLCPSTTSQSAQSSCEQ